MSSGAITSLELPLDSDVWGLLQDEAVRSGRPTVSLVSDVVANWVHERQRQRIAQEIAEFAATHAGTELDLDSDLESAAFQTLGEES